MSTVGSLLRQAREAKGLSVRDLAERTRIKSQQIEGFERDDFSVSPAPMYTKGFLKLCAQELELDPAPLLEAFAEQMAEAKPKSPVVKPGAVRVSTPVAPVRPAVDGNPLAPAEEAPPPKRIPVRGSLRPAGTGVPEPKRELPNVFGGIKSVFSRFRLPGLPPGALKAHLPTLGMAAGALLLLFLLIRGCQVLSGPGEEAILREPLLLDPMPLRLPLPGNTP